MRNSSLIVAVSLLLVVPHAARAQYPFGKNKVMYSSKEWKVLETEHVDIYHYPSERDLVLLCAPLVEETYREYSELFGVTSFRNRVPLVLFSSHYDFEQTNILPTLISDYTAGFTDLIKGRIAIPFSGSLGYMRHVIRHEMAHAFMLEKLDQVMKEHGKYNLMQPPLWFTEGLAEFAAMGEKDTQSHMYVRDALINGQLYDLENIWRIEGSFLMYKQGEAVVRYIATNFGREAVRRILENWWLTDNFSIVLKRTIDMDIRELNDSFMKYLRRRYYPAILHASFVSDIGTRLTEPYTFHSRPVARMRADSTLEVFALCAEHGAISVCAIQRDRTGKLRQRILIEGGQSSSFESIPALRSKMELRGDTLLFVSKSKDRDVIYLWDVERNREIDAMSFEYLMMISSPTLSPDRQSIVFSAIDTSGLMNLYRYRLNRDELTQLTHDVFSEESPDYHPYDDTVLFVSDRCSSKSESRTGLYRLDMQTGDITPVTCGTHSDSDPEWLPDGSGFLFTSDADGVFDTYLYRGGTILRQTDVLGGLFTPSAPAGEPGFVATAYSSGEYSLYYIPFRKEPERAVPVYARVDSAMNRPEPSGDSTFAFIEKPYKMKLGLDLVGAGVAIDPDYGDLGNGAEIVLSDILGNHQFYTFFGNTSEGFDDFWKRINAGVYYVNLSHRLNYLLGVFHLTTYWGDYFAPFRFERRYGGTVGVSYPFSKFSRIEGSLVVRGIERESDFLELTGGSAKSVLASPFFSYIVDNTLWTLGGPLKGTRYYATVGRTFDLQGRGFESTTLHLDFRKYFNIGDRIVFASRFLNRNSWGGDFQLFYLGGPWDLRGYDFREFAGKSTYLVNTELRFPLIDHFALALPFGTIELPVIRGSIFFDAGKVTRFIYDDNWLGSFGTSVELNLGYAPVFRLNFTRTTDFDTISDDTKVSLFIGYNY
jgi:hypothetical protein